MKISGTHGLGGVMAVVGERKTSLPASGISGAKVEDPLTLSSLARSREAAAMHPRFAPLSVAAHRDPELASQLAYNYAHIVHQPIVDLSDEIAGTGPMKYAATGEPVTPERDAFYQRMAEDLQVKSLALYNLEMARGTDPADIFDKLIALGDAQPPELLAITDWNLQLPANQV